MTDRRATLFEKYNLNLTNDDLEKLSLYAELLLSYNKVMNLTSLTQPDDIWKTHFLDSSLLLSDGDFRESQRVLDVGTGAGFPGLVLAILCPDWQVTLLDSLKKRVDFLERVVSELDLGNVRVIHGRAEDAAKDPSYRENFDLVVSRAVAELRLLLELCVPFAAPDGIFVSYKGPKYSDELDDAKNAMNELSCECAGVRKYRIDDKERYLLTFKRIGKLSDRYPRRAGIPAKRPL